MTTKEHYRKSSVFGLLCFSALMCFCSPGTPLERLKTLEGVISFFRRRTASVVFVPPLPSISTGCEMSFTHVCCFKNTLKSYATFMQKGLRIAVTEQSGSSREVLWEQPCSVLGTDTCRSRPPCFPGALHYFGLWARGTQGTDSTCVTERITKISVRAYFPEVLRITLQDPFCTSYVFGCIGRFVSGPVGTSKMGKDAPGVTWGKRGAVPFFCCASLCVPKHEALSA